MEYREDDNKVFNAKSDLLNLCLKIIENKMTPVNITIFHHYLYNELKPKEIAAFMGTKHKIISVQWNRIKEVLKDNIQLKDINMIADYNDIDREEMYSLIKKLWKN